MSKYKCDICNKSIKPVAYNGEWGEEELYDCMCTKCSKHYILPFTDEEYDEEFENEDIEELGSI